MPWTGKQFAERHNKSLGPESAARAARIANAMLDRGVPEGEAIATANKNAKRKAAPAFRGRRTRSYTGP